jgi:hypothetical protein
MLDADGLVTITRGDGELPAGSEVTVELLPAG